MSAITITRRIEFDAGHRIIGHENKCKHLHGHRYKAEITCSAPGLDDVGRVIDFGVVKQIVGGWIDEHWDHNMILNADDPLMEAMEYVDNKDGEPNPEGGSDVIFGGAGPYLMKGNPTAENLAVELYKRVHKLIPKPITIVSVRIWETPNCYADFFACRA